MDLRIKFIFFRFFFPRSLILNNRNYIFVFFLCQHVYLSFLVHLNEFGNEISKQALKLALDYTKTNGFSVEAITVEGTHTDLKTFLENSRFLFWHFCPVQSSKIPYEVQNFCKWANFLGGNLWLKISEFFSNFWQERFSRTSIFCTFFPFLVHNNYILYTEVTKSYTNLPFCTQKWQIVHKKG